MNALEQMDIDEAQEIQSEQKPFKIENLEQATWAFRKIAAYKAKQNEIDNVAKGEMERVQSWQQKETENIDSSIEFFEGILRQYFSEQRQHDPKFKISTPYGKVTSRKLPKKYLYDDKKVIAWCKDNKLDGYIRVKEELDKVSFKKDFSQGVNTETGEVIPGMTVMDQGEKIEIKVD